MKSLPTHSKRYGFHLDYVDKIIPALETIGLGAFDHKGNINLIRRFK